MKKKKLTAGEIHTKITEQRFAFAILLCNILDSDEVANDVKSAVAASLLNTIEMSFISGDDDGLSNLINNSINQFCEKIEEEKGWVDSLRVVINSKEFNNFIQSN